ncbi:hypothetical protein [Levilactobacillus suantsaii]|uniref:hypothetical protein n=1 Tax=Levilactobacillus suantsaii TaxID=2292255 RepID=UPI001483332F|nr:hypothetical protein [Levilactobacillus suantsaii]QMU07859.1 hypothetical protein H3M12_10400 [Levilactobacillus suantsaii]
MTDFEFDLNNELVSPENSSATAVDKESLFSSIEKGQFLAKLLSKYYGRESQS